MSVSGSELRNILLSKVDKKRNSQPTGGDGWTMYSCTRCTLWMINLEMCPRLSETGDLVPKNIHSLTASLSSCTHIHSHFGGKVKIISAMDFSLSATHTPSGPPPVFQSPFSKRLVQYLWQVRHFPNLKSLELRSFISLYLFWKRYLLERTAITKAYALICLRPQFWKEDVFGKNSGHSYGEW